MKKILGRQDDLIICPNGRVIISPIFMNIMRDIPGIAQYRIAQESKRKLTISIVKDEKFSGETLNNVVEEVRKIVGENMSIKLSVVERIEREKSGKIRAVISNIKAGI